MLKNLLILPDGTELFSGAGTGDAIKSVTLTELVNSGGELTLGSTCANMLEVTALTPQDGLSLTAGDEVTLYKVDDAGTRHKTGVFVLEKPTKPTANTMKLTGYDRVIKLDRDLTAWLNSLTGWPYSLSDFASMVCTACGLTLVNTDIPNADFSVYQFFGEVTGRQIMQWIGEACCRFCRANADGEIELAWYTPAGVSITPSGDSYYFQNSLSYEEYQVEPVGAVQLRLADSEDGTPWPSVDDGTNSYIITGNPILGGRITADLLPVLQAIQRELPTVRYTPCKVSIPATLDIHAGNTVQITDKNGVTFTAYVMTKTQAGQKDTLKCTGSPRRDSATAQNNKSSQQRDAALKLYADNASNEARKYTDEENKKLNQLELLKRLTNEWVDEGIYLTEDGKLAVNASAILAGVLSAALLRAGILQSNDGETFYLDLDNGILKGQFNELHISGKTVDEIAGTVAQKAVDTSLGSYAETVTKDLNSLQAQIDGQIQTWFYSYLPTPSNAPAAEWDTEELKNKHLGDLFYVVDNDTHGGLAYRWALINGVYQWVLVEDVEVAKALADAAKAQDTADGKRRVFVAQPSPPYDKGDLWAQGSTGSLMLCNTARASGSYIASDWVPATDAINERTAEGIAKGAVDAQTQLDIFNKLTNNGVAQGFFIKDGQIYFNASFIAAGILDASLIKTGVITSEDQTVRLDLSNSEITAYNEEVDRALVLNYKGLRGRTGDRETIFALNLFTDGATLTNGSSGKMLQMYAKEYTLVGSPTCTETDILGKTLTIVGSEATIINPGKKKLYSGAVSAGGTFDVPGTANYDLFAIKLGTSSGACPSVVLAYKHENTIYGVGGWCGTETQYKELYFVSITFSGDTWTLVDAGVHDVYKAGSIGAGTQLQLKEVIGVI